MMRESGLANEGDMSGSFGEGSGSGLCGGAGLLGGKWKSGIGERPRAGEPLREVAGDSGGMAKLGGGKEAEDAEACRGGGIICEAEGGLIGEVLVAEGGCAVVGEGKLKAGVPGAVRTPEVRRASGGC
jgi:hypothetical protein